MKKNLLLLLAVFVCILFLITGIPPAKSIKPQQIKTNCNCDTSLPVKIKNVKDDFGAKGNNRDNDTWSFVSAADWLNKNCSDSFILKLYIPPGTYIVGLQFGADEIIKNPLSPNQPPKKNFGHIKNGFNILELINAKNIMIAGSRNTIIKYKNGLYFGGFDKDFKHVSWVPSGTACSTTSDPRSGAIIGSFLNFKNCSCITVEQLYLDGNNTRLNLGGKFGECNGYQLGHDGIDIMGSKNILIQNVSCNNFGRDGLMTLFSNGNPECIQLKNVTSHSNSRQGFSITAATNFTIENCSFSKTGTVFYNNPGAGVDIEPESGGTCDNITFSNCKFLDNLFCGLISDGYFPYVSDITFNDCEFAAKDKRGWSIWPKRMIRTAFNNCTIRGRFTHVAGIDSTDHIKFNNCTITDWRKGPKDSLAGWGGYLIDLGTGPPDDHFFEFNYCKFEIHKSLAITTVGDAPNNSDRIFNHCNWTFYVKDLVKIIPHFPHPRGMGFIGRFVNCTFNSNTFGENDPVKKNIKYYFIEIAPVNNSSDNKNTFAPQDGLNGNKFSRVQNNPAWMWAYTFSLKNF